MTQSRRSRPVRFVGPGRWQALNERTTIIHPLLVLCTRQRYWYVFVLCTELTDVRVGFTAFQWFWWPGPPTILAVPPRSSRIPVLAGKRRWRVTCVSGPLRPCDDRSREGPLARSESVAEGSRTMLQILQGAKSPSCFPRGHPISADL